MKKLLTFMMIMFVGLSGLIFGCSDKYSNLTVTITTQQARAEDGSITLYVGGASEEISITMLGAPKDFNYVPAFSFSNPEYISVNPVNNVIDKGVKKTITAIAPGTTTMTVTTSEGNKSASLTINVIKKATGITFKDDYTLALIRKTGATATINYSTALTISPEDSNQNFIKFGMETNTDDVMIDANTGVLTVIDGNTALDEVVVYAKLVDHMGNDEEGIEPTRLTVSLVDEILPEDITLYRGSTLGDILPENVITAPVTLAKNIDSLNYINVIMGVKTLQSIHVDLPTFTTSSPVTAYQTTSQIYTIGDTKYFLFRVNAIRYDLDYALRFQIELTGFEGQFDYYKDLDLICDLYAKDFEINNVVRTGEHELSLYTNDETNGSAMLVAVSNPREISDENGQFTVELYDGESLVDNKTLIDRYFEIKANGPVDILNTTFDNNTTFYIKMVSGALTTADSGRFKLVIKSTIPEKEDLRAKTTVRLLIKQGIQSIDQFTYVQNEETITSGFGEASTVKINFETIMFQDFTLLVTPSDASLETVKAVSTDEGVVKVERIGDIFRLIPQSVGEAQIKISSTTLDGFKFFNVSVYQPIDTFYVSLNSDSINNVGKTESNDDSLTNIVAKQGKNVRLSLTTKPLNAEYKSISYKVTLGGTELELKEGKITDDIFSLDPTTNTFTFANTTNEVYTVTITLTNHDGDEIPREFTTSVYIPIESIYIDTTGMRTDLYNPNNLGYFDLTNAETSYTSVNVPVTITPANATYASDIQYIVRVDGKAENSNILLRNGNIFSVNPNYPIESYPKSVFIVAQVQEFDRVVATSQEFIIRDPVPVESLIVDGVSNDLLYFKQGVDLSKDLKISTLPAKGVFNNKVKWVQLAEDSNTILDYADAPNRFDKTNAIFSVEYSRQENTLTILPKGVGNARLLIIPEDKITGMNGDQYVYDWEGVVEIFVSVADGSEANPYHISSYQDLKDVSLALDKFYVMTADVVVTENWTPLAPTDTATFMGGINGKYERLNKQYKITGLSYATAGTSPYTNFGLIGVNDGKLKNLHLTYDFVQTTFSSISFGGVAGRNTPIGTIENCTVSFSDVNISYQYDMYFGGLVGYNQGIIANSQSGIGINCTANIATQVSASSLYVGGMVGYDAYNTSVSGSLLNIGQEGDIVANYGTSGYDVIANINVSLPEGMTQTTATTAIGGVFGAVIGQRDHLEITVINNISVQGKIVANGFRNVGGFVGYTEYATINNCFSITRVTAKEFVGGFVGHAKDSAISYSSAENYNSDSLTARNFIVGENYLGGFAGKLQATQVTFSYVISYYTQTNTYDIHCTSNAETRAYVGGFAADVTDNSTINYCASYINISVNNSYCVGAFIGNLGVGNTVDNFYCRGFGTIQGTAIGAKPTGLNSDDEVDSDATYYSTYSISVIDTENPLDTTGIRVGNGSFTAADGEPAKFWATVEGINDGLPYITREDGKELFANLPLIIEINFKNNLEGYTPEQLEEIKQDGYIYVDQKTIILFYNNIDDGSLVLKELIEVNTYNLNTFADVSVTPLTQKTARLNITSSNTNVIKVNKDGTFQVVGTGSATLTVSSQLNYTCLTQINIIVKLGINDFNLYESSNLTESSKVSNDSTQPIEVMIKNKAPLFTQIEYQRELLDKDLNLQANQEINIRYVLGDSAYRENFIINKEWLYDNINEYYYVDIPYSEVASIIAKVKTGASVKLTAIPYINVTYKDLVNNTGMINSKVQLDYLAKDFYVNIKNGATNIYFESNSTNLEMTQLQTLVFTVVVETDIIDDSVAVVEYLYNQDNNNFDQTNELTITPSATETIYDAETNEVVAVKVKYSISYPYNAGLSEDENLLAQDREFKINFASSLKSSINKDLSLTIKPQSIVSVDLGIYSNYSDYLTKDGTDTHIFNGVPALLTIEVYPYFSRFDRLEVCYTTNSGYDITLTQLQFDRNKISADEEGNIQGVEKALSAYPTGQGSGEYIKGYGIKLNKKTGSDSLISTTDNIYSYSKLYYLSLLIGSEVPDLTQFDLQVKFYSDDVQVRPFDATYSIKSLSQPTISFALNNQGLKNNVPLGTSNLLDVNVNNFEGEIEWSVSILDSTGQPDQALMDLDGDETTDYYALRKSLLPTKVGSEYYFNVAQDAQVLLGKTVRLTATVTKTDNTSSAGSFTATYTDDFLITLYTIKSVKVESVSNNMLLLPIYTPYNLKLKVDAYYSDADYVFNVNGQDLTIRNLMARLENALSKEDIWYYLCNDQCLVEGHPSYHQLEAGNIKYNNIFNFISYNDYYAVYGYEVDQVTTIKANFAIGYQDGLAVVDLPEEGQTSTAKKSSTYDLEFNLMFDYQADIKNPIPIQTAEEFYAMEEGGDYRLIGDIELNNHTPITTAISSLDGNGYTIYITGFESYAASGGESADGTTSTQTSSIGLFANLGANSVLSNINVYYLQNVVNNSGLDEYTGEYVSDIHLPEVINALEVNATALSSITFGGIVATNDGIVTNCTTTGKLKFDINNEILTAGYNGGLVGVNNGYLTNSKVENFEFTSSGNIGGFVGQNNKIISTCYVIGAKLVNKSSNIDTFFTGGFVCENVENAEIYRSFTQGVKKTSDTTIVHTGGGIQTSGVAGGFVYLNDGNIQDCYSNIAVSASEMSAGFVFTNDTTGVINNCYSISKIASNSRTASPFTGIGRDGGVVVVYSGTISNCYYLAGDYYELSNEPAQKISLNDFATTSTFATYDLAMEADTPDNAEGHTWIVKDGKPVLVNTQITTFSRNEYVGKSKTYSDSYTFGYNTTNRRYEQADGSGYLQLTRTARSVYYETGGEDNHKVFLYPLTQKLRDPYTNIESIVTRWYEEDEGGAVTTYDLVEQADGTYQLVHINNPTITHVAVITNYTEVYSQGITTFIWENNQTTYPSLQNTENNPYLTIERDGAYEYLEVKVIGASYVVGSDSITIDLSLDRYNNCDLVFNNNTEDGFGSFTYKVVDNIQYYYTNNNVGIKTNPYLIYDLESFNAYLKDANAHTAIVSTRNYYRLVTDIDFAFKTPATSTRTLWGYLEGNSMTLSNIVLTYESSSTSQQSFGLFGEIKNSIITDLNIQVGEIVSSAHTYVGGLAGRAYAETVTLATEEQDDVFKQYTIISNVNVTSVDENSVVLGRNIVGGLVGYVTGDVRFTDITVSTNVNSVFVVPTEAGVKFIIYERLTSAAELTSDKMRLVGMTSGTYQDYNNYINNNISYAGAVFGILDAKEIDPAVNELDYDYHITNVTMQGEVHVAGRVVGGMFGLVAQDNLVNDATVVLQSNNQSLRGDFMTGGLVGENRGVLTNITLDYAEKDKETLNNTAVGVLSDVRNTNYFNNSANTTTIGGIVGFNNNGTINNAITHVDVRNLNSTVAGGAVGRMVGGTLQNVVATGSVRARSVMGGMVGTVNTASMLLYSNGFVYAAQYDLLPSTGTTYDQVSNTTEAGYNNYHKSSLPLFKDCVAANNWLISDAAFIVPQQNVYRIAGGFVGIESLRTDYQLDMYEYDADGQGLKADGVTVTEDGIPEVNQKYADLDSALNAEQCFVNCYYTYSVYGTANPAAGSIPSNGYMAPLYISTYDAPYITSDKNIEDKKPSKAINQLGNTQVTVTGNIVGDSVGLYGVTHFDMLYNNPVVYNNVEKQANDVYIVTLTNVGASLNLGNYLNNMLLAYGYKTEVVVTTTEGVSTLTMSFKLPEDVTDVDITAGTKPFSYVTTKVEELEGGGTKTLGTLTIGYKAFAYRNFNEDIWDFGDNFYATALSGATRYPSIKKFSKTYTWDDFISEDPTTDTPNLVDGRVFAGNGTESNPFQISTAEDLAKLAVLVNSNIQARTYNYANIYYKLMNDIDLSGKYWVPIGTTTTSPFRAIFDGDNHYINYTTINGSLLTTGNVGVFGNMDNASAVIKNLHTYGGYIQGATAGGIVGYVSAGTIENCTNANTVIGTNYAGGVVGRGRMITNCSNYGNISLEKQTCTGNALTFIGGIAGYVEKVTRSQNVTNEGSILVNDNATNYIAEDIVTLYVGGLYGYVNEIDESTTDKITDTNSGNITVNSSAHKLYVGGYAGLSKANINYQNDSGNNVSRAQVVNKGTINVRSFNANDNVSEASKYSIKNPEKLNPDDPPLYGTAVFAVGGIIGFEESLYESGTYYNRIISRAANNGNITFTTNYITYAVSGVGGIVGMLDGKSAGHTIEECYNVNTVSANIVSSVTVCGVGGIAGFAYGTVTVAGTGIGSFVTSNNIINCYNMGEISGGGQGYNFLGGILGTSAVISDTQFGFGYNLVEDTNLQLDYDPNALINYGNIYIKQSYNIGIINYGGSYAFGRGSIVGYSAWVLCDDVYYLKGTADYAGYAYDATGETAAIANILTDGVEQKTSNNMKYYYKNAQGTEYGISLLSPENSTIWTQEINTWYPTLANNYVYSNWADYTQQVESISSNTYGISTAEQLAALSAGVNSGTIRTEGLTFKLQANIDLSNKLFEPIGTADYPFRGTFDGDGYTIKYMTINATSALKDRAGVTYGALFGYTMGATITNVGLIAPTVQNVNYAAGFVVNAVNTNLSYCYNEIDSLDNADSSETENYKYGKISANVQSAGMINIADNSTITRSYSNTHVYAAGTGTVAGLIHTMANGSSITDSYLDDSLAGANIYIEATIDDLIVDLKDRYGYFALEVDQTSSYSRVYNLASAKNTNNTSTDTDGKTIVISYAWNNNLTVGGVVQPGFDTLAGSGDPTPTMLESLGWDMINVWSSEYALNENNKTNATIRKLGKNWINSECEDLVLTNANGKSVLDREDNENLADFNYYNLSSAKELAWVAYNLNNGFLKCKTEGVQIIFRLTKDIDLNGKYWTPIGTLDNPFNGVFDFNNYSIKNMIIDSENTMYAGLFGYAQDAAFKNGYIFDSYIKVDATGQTYEESSALKSMYMGTLVAKAHNTSISNVQLEANLTGYSKYNIFTGGVSGSLTYANSSTASVGTSDNIKLSNIKILQPDKPAKIPDEYRAEPQKAGVEEVTSPYDVNIGAFSTTGNTYVGGVVGYLKGAYTASNQNAQAYLERVNNKANIVSYSSNFTAYTYGGGIVGYLLENGKLNLAQNDGKVKTFTRGYDYTGGIVGMVESSQVTNVYNSAYIECSQYNSALSYAGGLFGYVRSGSIIKYAISTGDTYKNLDSTQIVTGGAVGYILKDADGTVSKVGYIVYKATEAFVTAYNGDTPDVNDAGDFGMIGLTNEQFDYGNTTSKTFFDAIKNGGEGWDIYGSTVTLATEKTFTISGNVDVYLYNELTNEVTYTTIRDFVMGQKIVLFKGGLSIEGAQNLVFKYNYTTLKATGIINANNLFEAYDPEPGSQNNAIIFTMPSFNVTIEIDVV